MIRFPCPPWNHQNGTFSVGRAATEPTTTMAHGHVREKNAKQNAPRAIGRSNWRSVVRFVFRFSRARVRTASVLARPHVQTGLYRTPIPPSWGRNVFQVFGVSGVQTLAPCELSPYGLLLDKKYFLPKRRCRRED